MGGVKIIWEEQYLLLHFHYLISLKTAKHPESEVFLLRISSGNVIISGVIACQYLLKVPY